MVGESEAETRAGRASSWPSASTTQIAPVGPRAKNSASSSWDIETGPLLRGLDMPVGEIGGADLGDRQSDEAPLAAEKAVAHLRHDRVGHALIRRTFADELVDLNYGRLVDVREAAHRDPALVVADQARGLGSRAHVLDLGALCIGGEVEAAGVGAVGHGAHGIADRTLGAVAAEQECAVVATDELDDVRRVERRRDHNATGVAIATIMSATTAIISSRSTATVWRWTVCQARSSSPITATPMTSGECVALPAAIAWPSFHDARVTMRLREFRKSSSSGADC